MNKYLLYGIVLVSMLVGLYVAAPLVLNKTANEQTTQTVILAQGQFIDADATHKASGTAKVFENNELFLENVDITNGPDLKVYLATDETAKEFVDLGKLRANKGNLSYVIPEGIDTETYNTVVIWCRAFSVLFGSASLS